MTIRVLSVFLSFTVCLIQAVRLPDIPNKDVDVELEEKLNHTAALKKVDNLKGSVIIIGMAKSPVLSHLQKAIRVCDVFPKGQCFLHLVTQDIPENMGPQFTFALDKDLVKPGGRTDRLANLRNLAISSAIKSHPDANYLIMTDLDGIVRWDLTTSIAVAHAFKPHVVEKWDAITFTSTNYYDWWALRCSSASGNCRAQHRCKAHLKWATCWQDADKNPESLVPVSSAFNGLEIFKVKSLGDCRYSGKHDHQIDCEHVEMNRCLEAKGKKVMMSGTPINTGKLNDNNVSFINKGELQEEENEHNPYDDHFDESM